MHCRITLLVTIKRLVATKNYSVTFCEILFNKMSFPKKYATGPKLSGSSSIDSRAQSAYTELRTSLGTLIGTVEATDPVGTGPLVKNGRYYAFR